MPTKVLIIGAGGREHALCWRLAQDAEVFAAPGNPGIEAVATCLQAPATDIGALLDAAQRIKANLVVFGPETPLIAGAADALREAGFAVFGPGKEGAQLEGSKAYSKDLMNEAGVPTAEFCPFTNVESAQIYAEDRFAEGRQLVVKASGEAQGKGVIVCSTLEEARAAIKSMMVDKVFGPSGETIVIEERLKGSEFSLLTLCSDGQFMSLPVAQDYKRAFDGDRGPNTGGMGSYSPAWGVSEDVLKTSESGVVTPALDLLTKRGISYRGVLYSGLMVDKGKPFCLEYNVRFGDPETQSMMPRIGAGFLEALTACAKGEDIPSVEVLKNCTVTVIVASHGYPGNVQKGLPISIGKLPDNVHMFHAGTRRVGNDLQTNGGRVLGITGVGSTIDEARARAYDGVAAVQFEGKQFRKDIAQTV